MVDHVFFPLEWLGPSEFIDYGAEERQRNYKKCAEVSHPTKYCLLQIYFLHDQTALQGPSIHFSARVRFLPVILGEGRAEAIIAEGLRMATAIRCDEAPQLRSPGHEGLARPWGWRTAPLAASIWLRGLRRWVRLVVEFASQRLICFVRNGEMRSVQAM